MLRKIQNAFTSGELSPELAARTDFEKYESGCRTLKNWIVRPYGGVSNRTGFRYIATTKNSSKKSRLIEFEFSDTQAYILEFGEEYIRFYMDGGQIQSAGAPYEVASSYLEEDLDSIHYTQSADVLYLFHPDYTPRKLVRTGHASWTQSEIDFRWPPFRDENTDADLFITASVETPGDPTGLTASNDLWNEEYVGQFWKLGGGYVKITAVGDSLLASGLVVSTVPLAATSVWSKGAWNPQRGYPRTATFDNDRLVAAGNRDEPQRIWGSVIGDYVNHKAGVNDDDAYRHRIGAQKANVIKSVLSEKHLIVMTNGGEWVVGVYGQYISPSNAPRRRESAFGSSNVMPFAIGDITLYLQRPGKALRSLKYEYESEGYTGEDLSLMAEHLTKSNVIVEMAYQQSPNQIIWCVRDDGVLLGLTYMPEHKVTGWHRHETQGTFESCAVIPSNDEDELWTICNRTVGATTVRYIERLDPSFRGNNTYDAFFLDSGLSYDPDEVDITDISQTNPAVVTAPGHSIDASNMVRFTEVLGMTEVNYSSFEVGATTATTFELAYVNGAAYTAYISGGKAKKAITHVTGLGHLEGKTVSILASGATVPDEIVVGGSVLLDYPAVPIHAGLSYECDLETLDLDVPLQIGTFQGLTGKIVGCILKVYNSFGAWIGPDEDNLKEIMFWSSDDYLVGAPPGLFTGNITGEADFDYSPTARVFIRHQTPLPMTVLGIITEIEV
jgi:hypothetical protein